MHFSRLQPHMKGAIVYDVLKKQILISRNVIFHEMIFPYQSSQHPAHHDLNNNFSIPNLSMSHTPENSSSIQTTPNLPIPNHSMSHTPENLSSVQPTPNPTSSEPTTSENTTHTTTSPTPIPPPPRKSTRPSKPPLYLQDYICNTNSSYPLHHYLSYANLSSNHKSYTLSIDTILEPTSYKEASKDPCWVEAMQK